MSDEKINARNTRKLRDELHRRGVETGPLSIKYTNSGKKSMTVTCEDRKGEIKVHTTKPNTWHIIKYQLVKWGVLSASGAALLWYFGLI